MNIIRYGAFVLLVFSFFMTGNMALAQHSNIKEINKSEKKYRKNTKKQKGDKISVTTWLFNKEARKQYKRKKKIERKNRKEDKKAMRKYKKAGNRPYKIQDKKTQKRMKRHLKRTKTHREKLK